MKSKITFTCENYNCEKNKQQVNIEIPDFFIGKCKKRYMTGKLDIEHGDKKFNSSESLVEYLKGLMKEQKLLNKMKLAGIADKEELNNISKITEILKDAVCPCCNMKPTLE